MEMLARRVGVMHVIVKVVEVMISIYYLTKGDVLLRFVDFIALPIAGIQDIKSDLIDPLKESKASLDFYISTWKEVL